MQVLQVIEYNRQAEIKYHKNCGEWQPKNGGFPQAAFYFYSTNYGSFRRTGYVAFDITRSIWRPTKKEAIQTFKKQYGVA